MRNSEQRIVKVLGVCDTRDWDDNVEPARPIPGSGDARDCDRCGRLHEVHVYVRLSDGSDAVIGTGCAKGDDLALVRKAATSARTVARLERELAKALTALEAATAARELVDAMERPPVDGPFRDGSASEWRMGDARVWQHDDGDITPERLDCLMGAWAGRRMAELTGDTNPVQRSAIRVEDLERRLERARKRLEN